MYNPHTLFCETGERLKKRSTELTLLSNEISSLIDSQTVWIQELEMMSSNKVLWIYYENVSYCCCHCIVCFWINDGVCLWSERVISVPLLHGYLYLTATVAYNLNLVSVYTVFTQMVVVVVLTTVAAVMMMMTTTMTTYPWSFRQRA
jgi:hypothetical protein